MVFFLSTCLPNWGRTWGPVEDQYGPVEDQYRLQLDPTSVQAMTGRARAPREQRQALAGVPLTLRPPVGIGVPPYPPPHGLWVIVDI